MSDPIESLRSSYQDFRAKEEEAARTSIPFITEETLDQLVHELNLPRNVRDINLRGSLTGELQLGANYRTRMLAEHIFKAFGKGAENGLLTQIESWLRENYGTKNSATANSSTVGMAYVLRAFQIQEGPTLMDGLNSIHAPQLIAAFKLTTPELTQEAGIISRIKTGQSIPDFQTYLNEGLHLLKIPSPNEAEIEEGATAMYTALDNLWPAIVDPSQRQKLPDWY